MDASTLAQFVAETPNAMAMFDLEMQYVAASPRWLTDYHLRETPLGRGNSEVFPKIGDDWEAVHRRCLAGATEGSEGERFERADGSVLWVSCDARLWTDADGAVGGIVVVSQDVTALVEARRQAEDAARRAEAAERRLKDAIDTLPAGFDLYDADDRLIVSNSAAEAMYPHTVEARRPGILFEDLLRVGVERRIHGPSEKDNEDWLQERMERHRTPSGPVDQLTVDGQWLRIEERRLSDGGIVVIRADVTDIKEREQELGDKTALLEATLHAMGEGIVVHGADGKVRLSNTLAAQLLDAPRALVEPAASVEDLIRFRARRGDFGDVDVDVAVKERMALIRAGTIWRLARSLPGGRIIEACGEPMPDGGGVFVFRDVTARADAEAKLADKTAVLESTLENMGEGVAVFGPDLRLRMFNKSAALFMDAPPWMQMQGGSFEDLVRFRAERGDFGDLGADAVDTLVRDRVALFREQRPWSQILAAPHGRLVETRFTSMPDGGALYVYRDVTERETDQAKIREEEAKFRGLVEQDVAGIAIVHEDGTIGYSNRHYARLLGYEATALSGHKILEFLSESDQVRVMRERARLFATGAPLQISASLHAKGGRVVEALVNLSPISFEGRAASIAVVIDVTERRKAEDALRASEERFRMLIEEAPDAILIWESDTDRPVIANRAAERLFGVPRNLILEGDPTRFYAPSQPDGRTVAQSYAEHEARARTGEEVRFLRRIRRPPGEERLCQVTLVSLPVQPPLLRTSFVDVTEQALAEAEVVEVRHDMSVRQEAERHAIARELHDSLGQYLAAMNIKLALLARNGADAASLKSGLADLTNLTSAVGSEVSRLAWELRPISLDDIGLEAAVRHLGEEWGQRSGLRFDLHLAVGDRRLPSNVETTLYRVAQEAITNVVKHAMATRVGIILKASEHDVVMIVEDNGTGFDPEAVKSKASHRFGLLGIRERLMAVHGHLDIETSPGAGTTLIVRVALDDCSAAIQTFEEPSWARDLLRRAEIERGGILDRHVDDRAAALAHAIAERQQADARFLRTTALLRAIGENSPDAIYAKDTSGRFLYANPAALAIIGKGAEIVLGHTDAEWYFDPGQAAVVMANDQRVMRGGAPEIVEEVYEGMGIGTRTFRSAKAPFVLEDGSLAGIVGVSSDITERKAAVAGLQTARAEAERANRAKSTFLAAAGRDLRQPVQSLTLLLSVIKGQVAGLPDAFESVREAEAAVTDLSGWLTAILDVSRLDVGAGASKASGST